MASLYEKLRTEGVQERLDRERQDELLGTHTVPPDAHVGPEPGTSIEENFWAFHRANPRVYGALVRLAREARSSGAGKLGMKSLFEVLRWERGVSTRDWSGFKLNNNYTSYYARLIMHNEPDLRGVFEIRVLRVAEPID